MVDGPDPVTMACAAAQVCKFGDIVSEPHNASATLRAIAAELQACGRLHARCPAVMRTLVL